MSSIHKNCRCSCCLRLRQAIHPRPHYTAEQIIETRSKRFVEGMRGGTEEKKNAKPDERSRATRSWEQKARDARLPPPILHKTPSSDRGLWRRHLDLQALLSVASRTPVWRRICIHARPRTYSIRQFVHLKNLLPVIQPGGVNSPRP